MQFARKMIKENPIKKYLILIKRTLKDVFIQNKSLLFIYVKSFMLKN